MNSRLGKRKVKNIQACEIFGDPAKFSEGQINSERAINSLPMQVRFHTRNFETARAI